VLRDLPDAPVAASRVEACLRQADASLLAGPATFTTAELRVLRLLPDPPLVPRDGRRPARDREHGQDPRAFRSPQARRVVALGGRRERARPGLLDDLAGGVTVPRRAILRGRVRRQQPAAGEKQSEPTYFVDLEPGELSGVFAAPTWLRDFGVLAWLLVGISLLMVARGDAAGADEHDRHPRRHGVRSSPPCAPRSSGASRGTCRARRRPWWCSCSLLAVGSASSSSVLGGIVSQASAMQSTLQKAVDKLRRAR
jgi:hypothetical protein